MPCCHGTFRKGFRAAQQNQRRCALHIFHLFLSRRKFVPSLGALLHHAPLSPLSQLCCDEKQASISLHHGLPSMIPDRSPNSSPSPHKRMPNMLSRHTVACYVSFTSPHFHMTGDSYKTPTPPPIQGDSAAPPRPRPPRNSQTRVLAYSSTTSIASQGITTSLHPHGRKRLGREDSPL